MHIPCEVFLGVGVGILRVGVLGRLGLGFFCIFFLSRGGWRGGGWDLMTLSTRSWVGYPPSMCGVGWGWVVRMARVRTVLYLQSLNSLIGLTYIILVFFHGLS
jgi:hypothetical protein